MKRSVVVIGAGIVGAAIASGLSETNAFSVTVIDKGPAGRPQGSTGHAPGYLGVLGDRPVLTGLARASATAYEELNSLGISTFTRGGAIELATTPAALTLLLRRAEMAKSSDLPAHLCDPVEAAALAPYFVARNSILGGLFFPIDGTARASIITKAYKERSESAGARFVNHEEVVGFELSGSRIASVRTSAASYPADDIIVASGIWSQIITGMVGFRLPLTPVAHPYVYCPRHRIADSRQSTPFVRWPEHHVYARDHGDRLGLGTYDHNPVAVDDIGLTAERRWEGKVLDDAIETALELVADQYRFVPERRLNGVFAMTPDNLPFLGRIPGLDGLWVTAAIWVTHAAGAAKALVDLMLERPPSVPGIEALAPDRFSGEPDDDLKRRAFAHYRDIYKTA